MLVVASNQYFSNEFFIQILLNCSWREGGEAGLGGMESGECSKSSSFSRQQTVEKNMVQTVKSGMGKVVPLVSSKVIGGSKQSHGSEGNRP